MASRSVRYSRICGFLCAYDGINLEGGVKNYPPLDIYNRIWYDKNVPKGTMV